MLDEFVVADTALELLAIHEVIVGAVALAGARRARGGRDRQLEVRVALQQAPDQGPLADARGPGDNDHFGHRRHASR